MDQAQQNKKFMMAYYNTLSGHKKTEELLRHYITDKKLIRHILYMEESFPKYELVPDEILAEGKKVFVRARFKGKHSGKAEGVPATFKKVNTPFAVGYQIKDNKIIDFWAIADQIELLEQMGLAKEEVNVPRE